MKRKAISLMTITSILFFLLFPKMNVKAETVDLFGGHYDSGEVDYNGSFGFTIRNNGEGDNDYEIIWYLDDEWLDFSSADPIDYEGSRDIGRETIDIKYQAGVYSNVFKMIFESSELNVYFYTNTSGGGGGSIVPPTVESPHSPEPPQPVYLDSTRDALKVVSEVIKSGQASDAVITFDGGDGGHSLPIDIMQTLIDNPTITFDMYFVYEGLEHRVIIPAGGAIVDPEIEWYGPEWLLKQYGDSIGLTEGAVTGRTYEVVEGDTIGNIAKKYGMSVEELLAKNPGVSDRDLIFPGDILYY